MCDYDEYRDYKDLADVGWSHGWAFGKYASQTILNDKFLSFLSNNPQALKMYQESYNKGFNAGLADNGLFVNSVF